MKSLNARRPQDRTDVARARGTSKVRRAAPAGIGAALVVGGALAPPAEAATFNVTNLNDAGAGSLRQAIDDANAAAGADVVTFQAGLTGTITLTTGQLAITDSLDIQGPGQSALTVSGNGASRVFYLYSGSALLDVTISGLTISNGNASIGGGLVDFDENLTLDRVTITGNTSSGDGAGLWADGFNMSLTVRDSTISGNAAGDDGGGIYIEDTGGSGVLLQGTVISNNSATDKGGGIYLYDPDTDVTIRGCTISGNTAGSTGGGIYLYSPDSGTLRIDSTTISGNSAAAGAGVYFYDLDHGGAVENCTISGNTATGGPGGGVLMAGYDVEFRHTTIAGNSSVGYGAGIFLYSSTVALSNSILADNTSSGGMGTRTTAPAVGARDLGGSGTFDVRYSLVEDSGSATVNDLGGNVFSQDPQLSPLAANGGATRTMAIAGTSPARNAGDPTFAAPPDYDQRGAGFPRVRGGRVDMGAYEAIVAPGTVQFSVTAVSVSEDGGTATITVTRSGGAEGPASVSFATSNGSAVAPADYVPAAGTLNWADGDAAPKTFQVTIVDNVLDNPDKTVNLTLSAPTGATLGTAGAVLTILDNDAAGEAIVPVLDPAGLAGLGSLIGLAGAALLRRRKGSLPAALGASALAAGLVAGSALAAANPPVPARSVKTGSVAQVTGEGRAALLRITFEGGETMEVPVSSVELKDHRKASHDTVPTSLAPGQAVVVKIRANGPKGRSSVVVALFDDEAAAKRHAARPGHGKKK